jgi:phage baseplate assembly protein W
MAAANTVKDFLGTGWSFPPTFSNISYSVEMVSDDQDIRESLWVLFSTQLGERIMVPAYGSDIWQMVFRTITTTLMSQLKTMVKQAILNWEPRIDVDDVKVQRAADVDGMVLIAVNYTIRTTNTRSNLVYPFYLTEATIPAIAP